MNNTLDKLKFGTDFMSFLKKNNLPEPKFWYGDVVIVPDYTALIKYIIWGLYYTASLSNVAKWEYVCNFEEGGDMSLEIFYEEDLKLFEDED